MKDQELRLQLLRHYKAVIDLAIREDSYGKYGVGYFKSDRDYFGIVLGIDFDKFYNSKENFEIGKTHKKELAERLSFLKENERWGFIGDTMTQILHNRLTSVKFDKINNEFEDSLAETIIKTYNVFLSLDKVANLEKEVAELKAEIKSLKQMEIK